MALKNDKRLNPQLLSALSEVGLDSIAPPPPVSVLSSVEDRLQFIASSEPLYRGLFASIYQSIDLPNNVVNETRIIKDEDGNEIKLYISRPKNISSKLPGILHIHGGGMAILTANDPNYIHWRQSLAAKNLVVVGVEFFQKRENMDAISNLNMAIKINPNYAEAYSLRGLVKSFLGDGYGAISDYSKAIKLGKLDCYAGRGNIKHNLGDLNGALLDYDKAIDFDQNNWFIFTKRALLKEEFGDFEGALYDYTKAIEINPNDWVGLQNRGLLKIKMGQKESGCLDLSRVGEMGISNVYKKIKKHCN